MNGLDAASIEAVVFDIGGVFLVPHPDPICAALATAGIEISVDVDMFRWAHYRGVRGMTDAVAKGAGQPYETATAVWSAYDLAYFRELGVSPSALEAAVQARSQQRAAGVTGVWVLRLQDNIDAFHRLAHGSRPVAIVSNNDGSASEEMSAHGVCQLGPGPLPSVVALVDSTLMGIAKPDPRIFKPVMEALPHIPAKRMLYVGDTVHADVGGARNAGMQVVQLDPLALHEGEGHPTLPDVGALAELLR